MEVNAIPKVNWCSTLQTVKDEKKGFEADPIVNWEPMEPKLRFFSGKNALVDQASSRILD